MTGMLAALRAARRRHAHSLPAAEIDLIEQRTRIALLAGLGTVAGLELYVLNFALVLPAWYLAMIGGSAAIAGATLAAALGSLRGAAAIVSCSPGPAGDVYDDLPVPGREWLRRHPWRLGVLGSVALAIAGHIRPGARRAVADRGAPTRHLRGPDRARRLRAARRRSRLVRPADG